MARGIYAIVNSANGKSYVGASNNIERRWRRHRALLATGTHHSLKLQRAWAQRERHARRKMEGHVGR